MPRSTRIQFPGAFYHVMARGNRRAPIYVEDSDRALFLRTLGEACQRTGWRVHAWVLMSNHYHLLLETPQPNLVAGMQWLQNTYTRRFNTRHRAWGRLFGDRYKAVLVEGEGYYYETLLDYLHLNPVRAGLVKVAEGQSLLDLPWSSLAGGYALAPGKRPGWFHAESGLSVFSLPDTTRGRRAWVERLERRAREQPGSACGLPEEQPADGRRSHLREGWHWGSQSFAEAMLRLRGAVSGTSKKTQSRATLEERAHGEEEAERLLREGLAEAGLTPAACRTLPGSDERKVALAARIFGQTTVSLGWLAERLSMRSANNVAQHLHRHRQRHLLMDLCHDSTPDPYSPLDYDGAWINAGDLNVNKWPHISTTPDVVPGHFRKFTGASGN